ncbi:SDR family NAD(P)-dependent oxidoreductase [Brasilonema octagenarum]|uniref:Glycosyltransferase 2-like domain-containing protein n=1 Tax=Brasilonema octagenarum UFV-OR1 TaxID=417115 RepID=A0ABX1M5A2_9CYAN|nr:SDR family NAD(P)-dependent oxidoreductase [Brasilonema octagenarum]NMF63713.1 hypothetical protein [Brasilonema octagenarum UFV-OR1]
MKINPAGLVDVTNQVAIITGGGRGLGQAYAIALAAAGASVAVIARSADQLEETVSYITKAGGRAIALTVDVTDQAAVEKVVSQIEDQLGPVDLLINNAGVLSPLGPVWEIDPQEWWRNMEVNLHGPLLCTRYVLPSMIAQRRGRIINIASEAALVGCAYLSPYVVSKTALIRFSENLALETKQYGVSVFAICPGAVRTQMIDVAFSAEGQKWIPWSSKIFEKGLDVPPELAVDLVLRLASGKYDELSGQYMQVSDDLNERQKWSRELREKSLYALRLNRLQSVPEVDMSRISAILQLAVEHHRANRLTQAEESYHQVLGEHPNHPEALYGLGMLAQQSGHLQSAEQFLSAAVGVQPDSVKSWFSLGNLRLAQEQFPEAAIAYHQALALRPDSLPIYNNLGYALQQQGLFEEAINYYQKALELKPDFTEAEANLGNALHAQGKLSTEKQLYYAQLNHELGIVRKKAGDLKTAVAYYKQAIILQPNLVEAHFNLGVVLHELGELEEAIACYQKVLELNPNYPEVYQNLGKIYQQQNQLQKAAAAYRQWLKLINPHYAKAVEAYQDTETTPESSVTPPIPQTEVTVGAYQFPAIPPVCDSEKPRPFWSVVIPVYNRTDYLLECLASVLAQWPGEEEMEILVMENASQTPLFEMVNSIGKGVVRYYRNPENIGAIKNMNAGIALARGQWIHVIPDDDYVLPGFYSQLKQSLEGCSESIGAAFTGYENINDKEKVIRFQQVCGEYKGVTQDWLWKIGVANPLNMSAVVIRRLAHERLGGYLPELSFTSDWELYKRIATSYDWWCEPSILARFREHSNSITSDLLLSGTQIISIRRAIDISESYLPSELCTEITAKSRSHYFNYCLQSTIIPLQAGNVAQAWQMLEEVLKIDRSSIAMAKLFTWLTQDKVSLLRDEIAQRCNLTPPK